MTDQRVLYMRVPAELHRALSKAAATADVTVSAYVRSILGAMVQRTDDETGTTVEVEAMSRIRSLVVLVNGRQHVWHPLSEETYDAFQARVGGAMRKALGES